jgi:adenine phosphoribosyltransferase
MEELKALIRDIPDFPSAGILFRDVTPLLRDPRGLPYVVEAFAERFGDAGIDVVAGIESRGFIFGTPLAMRLGAGFVPVRKPGKLPSRTLRREYVLEYGTGALEIHADAIRPGERVLLVDDLLATGGTAAAAAALIGALGGEVTAAAFVVELDFLAGRRALEGFPVHSLVRY